jgi:hypothetical protein
MKKLKISQLLLIIWLIGSAAMASAQIDTWTAVGSTGTVDDADISILDTDDTIVQIKSTAPLPASLDIRYNVVAVDGVFSPGDGVRMVARFRDNGTAARVRVSLFEVPATPLRLPLAFKQRAWTFVMGTSLTFKIMLILSLSGLINAIPRGTLGSSLSKLVGTSARFTFIPLSYQPLERDAVRM